MPHDAKIIDAAVRFLRTNPQLLAHAQSAAPSTGCSVEQLLHDAVLRVREEMENTGPARTRRVARRARVSA
jgi:hypothetical protein